MQRPVIGSVWGTTSDAREGRYEDLAKVWQYSAEQVFGEYADIVCDNVGRISLRQKAPEFNRGPRKIGKSKNLAWREKVRGWARIVEATEIGRPLLLTDIDVAFFMNPFPDVLVAMDGADIGYCPTNSGAVYFSGSEESHAFMAKWLEDTERLFDHPDFYQVMDKVYKGLDQSSLQVTIQAESCPAKVANLPRVFHSTVHEFDIPCYIMHYHSKLRAVVFGDMSIQELPTATKRYARAWRRYLREANGNATGE